MRNTLALDDALMQTAQELTGLTEKSALVRGRMASILPAAAWRARRSEGVSRAGKCSQAGGARWHHARVKSDSAATSGRRVILADTSVWIDHLRSRDREMHKQLMSGRIAIHSFVIGELSLGSLKNRTETISLLDRLPTVRMAQSSEVRAMVEARQLYSHGIGWVDAHLVASVLLSANTLLWTRDQRLRKVIETLDLHVDLP